VESGFLLDVVVRESAAVFELLAGEDETLLIRWDALLVLNLCLDIVDGVGALNFQSDRLARQCLDENLHATTETKDQVESGFLLDVVVGESAAILELLAGEDETLLVRWNALLVLNLGLHIVDGVGRLNLEGDGLAGESLYEDLHTATETKDEMEGRLLLDVVVGEGAAILELLTSEDEALLIWRNAFLILNLGLDVVDGVARLHLEGDSLAGEGLHEDLHDEERGCGYMKIVCGEVSLFVRIEGR